MTKLIRLSTVSLAIVAGLLVFGFVVFGTISTRQAATDSISGDGIVVLTGGEDRIAAAAALLKEKRAKRLLISGVNKSTSRADMLLVSGLPKATFKCCVDLGYSAMNTIGNAHEARDWVKKHGFERIIVVTSGYHMPRSLLELSSNLPGTTLIPHTVMPDSLRRNRWWLHGRTLRVLFSEYLKFLPSAARYAAMRVVDRVDGDDTAETGDKTHAEL